MKKTRILITLFLTFTLFIIVGCKGKTEFKYWNDCNALTELKTYVANATNKNSKDYIPVEDRIAVFDMDGTLCGELFPEYLEYLLLEYRCLDDETYNASDELKEVATQIRESGKEYAAALFGNENYVEIPNNTGLPTTITIYQHII